MKYKRGDVILIFFPFTSGAGAKVRPALVVQNDSNNRRLHNLIVAGSRRRFIAVLNPLSF